MLGWPLLERKEQRVTGKASMKYLFAQEFLERVALRGIQSILAIFLLQNLHYSEVVSTELVHAFMIGVSISPLIGSFVSDFCTGNYIACYIFSYCELGGLMLLTTAAIPHPDWENSKLNHVLTPIAMFFVVLGSGALKPCQITFGGDQIKLNPGKRVNCRSEASREYFSAYYVAMNAGTLFSAIVSPTIRERGKGSYFYAFLMPTCSMALCIVVFWLGRKDYYYRPSARSLDASSGRSGVLALTHEISNETRKLIGVETEESAVGQNQSHMQELKDLIYVLFTVSPTPFFTALFFQTSSTWVFQARIMDGHMPWFGGITIEPDQMPALNPIFVVLVIPTMDLVVYPFVEKYVVLLPNLRRVVLAFVMASLAFVASGVLQTYVDADLQRKQLEDLGNVEHADISVLWQIPQYFLLSVGETLMFIPIIDWGYMEAPDTMRTVVQAVLHFNSAIGNLITILVVAIIGTSLSKATESFIFAGLGAFGALSQVSLSYIYVTKVTRLSRRREEQEPTSLSC